jgi:flagellar hook-associated protein 2
VTTLDLDETLTVTFGSTVTTVDLTGGSTLAQAVDAINAALAQDGIPALALNDGADHLRFRTNGYGSTHSITVVSDRPASAGSTGIGTTPLTGAGSDIQGTINGNAAVGSGNKLTGAEGFPEEGLALTIAQTTTGSYGSLTLSSDYPGVAGSSPLINLQAALDSIMDPLEGPIHASTDALNDTIADISHRISDYEDRLEVRREILLREFPRADEALRMLGVLQNSLSNQMASLSKF